jgi:glycerol-3-phosphate dehydrogenase (NAD(P)+)
MKKDFWSNSRVAVIGAGTFGTVLANKVAENCREVRLWLRDAELTRAINSTRTNPDYLPDMKLHERVHAFSEITRVFEGGVQVVVWVLPSSVTRAESRAMAPHFQGDEVILHATKGIEFGSLKRMSEVLREEIACPKIGVISGPNLALELAQGQPGATVIASRFDEVLEAGQALLTSDNFRTYLSKDMVGVEWAGTLKNVLAIASGALDALQLGWNARALLITRGLAEMVRFGVAMGAEEATFLSLAGIGDLLATCASPLSRNYRVGLQIAKGEKLQQVLEELGSTAEGVMTTRTVREYARENRIDMPITEGVYQLLQDGASVQSVIRELMSRKVSAAKI